MPCSNEMRCRSASASPARMPESGRPVIPGKRASQLVQERGLVRAQRRARQTEDEICDVVRSVLRNREEKQGEHPARVVVEAAEEAEVDEREAAVAGEQNVPAVRI